jgi:hypothetical protein
MIRSFGSLRGVNPGFDARNVLTGRVTIPTRRYPNDAKRIEFFANLVARLSSIPGVSAVPSSTAARLRAWARAPLHRRQRLRRQVGPDRGVSVCDDDYFRAIGAAAARPPFSGARCAVDRRPAMTRSRAPVLRRPDPLGEEPGDRHERPDVPTEIIGVVGDVKFAGLDMRPTR